MQMQSSQAKIPSKWQDISLEAKQFCPAVFLDVS